MEYLIRWRMLLAADRLKNSADGLCAIAQSLGYESESAFGKAFRRVMGCSPRQYATRPAFVNVMQWRPRSPSNEKKIYHLDIMRGTLTEPAKE
jgi:AraC-like DNA-binding protein